MQNQYKLILFSFLLFTVSQSFSQTKTYKNEVGFKSENDSFLGLGQDRYYTNGLFITFRTASNAKTLSDSAYMKKLPYGSSRPLKKIWSFSIGQQLYNAQTGAVPDITYVDRPFAAYLFAQGSIQFFDTNENSGKFSAQIGTIGPSALGEEAQKLIHHTFGFYDLNGWQYQIKNEIGINLDLSVHQLLHRSENKKVDFSYLYNFNLGTTFTGLTAGILFRTGSLNPLYHSIATQSNVSTFKEAGVNEKEFYFFLKPSLQFVVYDATIRGGLFRDDKGPVTFKTNPLVFSQEIGAAYAKKRWTVDFSVIFKSKEEKAMLHSHQYGSFDLYYRF
jgi:hypothetical protein